MATLPNAPLVEAWFQLRWGKVKKGSSGSQEFEMPIEDTDFFPGQFREVAVTEGFSCVERINPHVRIPIPHVITYRFRRAENDWPCYQIGLGIFTVNQVNEGYEWKKFKEDVLKGLTILNKGHPLGLEKLNTMGVQLQYRDGFVFNEGEEPLGFLSKNFTIGFMPPGEFLAFDSIKNDMTGIRIAFNLTTVHPEGSLVLEIQQGTINAQPGIIMDMIVRSSDDQMPSLQPESISNWLEESHKIQRHAFRTLINPAFARTFQ
jgi:uncharacterized protein (TIGR04255 family)